MTVQTEVSFVATTTNTDGSPITKPLSYTVFVDTVNPPVKSYPVPAANVGAAVSGVITVTFVQLGFVPVATKDYYVDVTATDTDGVSSPSASIQFGYSILPSAPTGLKVS